MKHDSDKEIDFLLRRHAQREAQPALTESGASTSTRRKSPHETGATGAHLDADEMNAYAEGALPVAARSRYAAHLADCDSCRKIVTRLALAANVAVENEKRIVTNDVAPSASWREWFAALFAPSVLRYAVPALAICAVMIVAFVAMRERQQTSFVAQNDQERVSSDIPAAMEKQSETSEQIAQSSGANDTTASSRKVVEANRPAANAPASSRAKEDQTSTATSDVVPMTTEPPAPAMVAKDDSQTRAEDSRADEVARSAPSAPPPAEMSPVPERDRENEKKEVSKVQGSKLGSEANQVNTAQSGARVQSEEVATLRQLPAKARRSAAGRSAVSPESRARGAADVSDEDSAATRNVGGRRFRRQGSAWVDTSYNSTRSTTHVRRGSEQYRALMADEPGLRSIAEQLSGEVIVVWKGRAYRIY